MSEQSKAIPATDLGMSKAERDDLYGQWAAELKRANGFWEKSAWPPLVLDDVATTTTNFPPLKECGEFAVEGVYMSPPSHVTVTLRDFDGKVLASEEMALEEFQRRFGAEESPTERKKRQMTPEADAAIRKKLAELGWDAGGEAYRKAMADAEASAADFERRLLDDDCRPDAVVSAPETPPDGPEAV